MANLASLSSTRPSSAHSPGGNSYLSDHMQNKLHITTTKLGHDKTSTNSGPDSDHDDAASSASTSSDLPFPASLARRDFLAQDFDPAVYLASLHAAGPAARHQSLEDLRAELRERSDAIGAELLSLINTQYASFLGLGDGLRGGDERVADLRVAVLGFRRGAEEVLARVRCRRREIADAVTRLTAVRKALEQGRKMLELEERTAQLEGRLVLDSLAAPGNAKRAMREADGVVNACMDDDDDGTTGLSEGEEDEDDEEDDESGDAEGLSLVGSSPAKLAALAREYMVAERLASVLGRQLPFVRKMEERLMLCRNPILLDLNTAVKEARAAGPKAQVRTLKYLAIYRMLDAGSEAVQAIKK